MDSATNDFQRRQAALDQVSHLAAIRGGVLDSGHLAAGFQFEGQRFPLINRQRGIFKPRQMAHLLSIKTVFPRRGAGVWNDEVRRRARLRPPIVHNEQSSCRDIVSLWAW